MFGKTCTWSEEQINARAEELVSKMDLKEKCFFLSGNWQMLRDAIVYKRTYNPVPICSHGNRRLGIKPIAFTDGPRGVVMGNSTCFPVSMARAASFDRELEQEIGSAIGEEARAQKANYFAGVCINLLMHPAGGRAQESYGEDPYLVGEMGAELVKGVQSQNVMACAKHYAVNNMENLRFSIDVDCSERTLREVYLPHFKKAVDAGCASLMGAYNRFRGDQASESKYLLTDILRNEWGFQGFLITDFIFALRDAAKAMNAGMDMEMPLPVHYGLELKKAVQDGKVSEKTIDEAVRRVLRTQLTFEKCEDPREDYDRTCIANAEHIALAKRAAEESMVLIKNENSVLPFSKDVKNVLVIGKLADQANTGDHGSSSVYPPYVVTALEGIKKLLGDGASVTHLQETELEKIREMAPKADAVIVIAGNDYNDEGEFVVPDRDLNPTALMGQGFINNGHPLIGKMMSKANSDKAKQSYTSTDGGPVGGDRHSLSLRDAEIEAIRTAGAVNRNTAVVLVCGSMLMTKEWDDTASAILYGWYAGMEGGNVLASILFGDVNPSGKLPFTIPTDEKHLPEVDFFNATSITYDYYHGYRKLDHEGHRAAYPFGHGLSYTQFSVGAPKAERKDGGVEIRTEVTNTGKTAGAEIVQVYVSVPDSKVERHVKELKGFARLSLAPGETKECVITVPDEELRYFDEKSGKWVLEPGVYEFLTGDTSDAEKLQKASVTIA